MKSFFDLTEKSVIVPGKDVKDPTPGKKPTFKPNVSGIFEATHEEAEEHMSKAMDAHKEGNEALHHRHLSDYHDKMAEWHSERGREGSAEKHERMADHHHEKALSLGEATSARMRFAAALNREQERIERERRLANPPSKPPEKEEPKKAVSEESKGLWANIHAKRKRIENGSGERMRKPGSKGAPTADALKRSANEGVSEETIDRGEYDYEGQMARTQLQTIMRNSKDMIDMIKDDDNMPEWVQSKITLSHDYITTARDYLQSKQELGEDKDPCWDNYKQIGMKKKNGKQVPNCVPESYDDNRRGFAKRPREDDEYHVPDTVTTNHKIAMNVSRPGVEKHNRTVTISNSTKTHDEAKATARAHLQKQGYTIHEEREPYELAGVGRAHAEGIKARNQGKQRHHNPYSATKEARKNDEWEKGWVRGKHVKEEVGKQFKKDDAPFDGPYKSVFKKPNNPNRTGMDSARSLAQRAMDQVKKKENVRLTKEDTNHAIDEGIARLISKSIKRVTATKPTPQEKADIRLNK